MHLYLDSPQTIDCEALLPDTRTLLANAELRFYADNASDLYDLTWPWADAIYAASIRLRVTSLIGDELTPISNRYFASHQETILGNESIIVSKRLMAPFKSSEDRSVIWNLECQAEGDHVLRLEVEIDWGEPLTQRIVDGLLVAQHNPQAPRGLYEQSNAESTRVFGNPQARPDLYEIDDPQRARLVYHVLVNGEVQVPLLLTLSDVGEQMAWSTFLGLRESDETFDKSVHNWEETLRVGRLWTPDASLNQAVQLGRILALHNLQQFRSGYAAYDQSASNTARLIAALDTFEPTLSRNLLATFRRLAEQTSGRMPLTFPSHPKSPQSDPGTLFLHGVYTYFQSLAGHLSHQFDAELLTRHFAAIQLCSEALIRHRWEQNGTLPLEELQTCEAALRLALRFATIHQDEVSIVRWEGEVTEFQRLIAQAGGKSSAAQRPSSMPVDWIGWSTQVGWTESADRPWRFADFWRGIDLAAKAVWQGVGLDLGGANYTVQPTFPEQWSWWALLDLPTNAGKLRAVWDGNVLHSTLPIQSTYPVQVHSRIRALGFEELSWDPRFEFVDEAEAITRFYPKFDLC
ncbi:MAG: hypothetical protein U0175_09775 [Caldilineaceae bacterium]